MEKFFRAISVFLRYVTPIKTFLLVVTVFAMMTAAVIWENRQSVYNKVMDVDAKGDIRALALSEKSRARLDALVTRKSSYVIAGTAMGINIALNTRSVIYRVFNDKELELRIRTVDAREGIDLPLFSSNEIQNKQVLSLLRGEFSCSRSPSIPGDSRYGSVISDKVTTTCRVPIPPAYGHLMGYIVFFLSREPTDNEIDELRSDAYTISMAIYNEMQGTSSIRRID